MNKRIMLLALIVVLVTGLTGFATRTVSVAQGKPIVYNSYNGDPSPRAFDEKTVKMWNDKNPDNQVQLNIVAHEDFKQAIRTYLVADPSPDILTWFAGNRARFFISKGLIAPIDDLWQSEGWDKVYPPAIKGLGTYEGKVYFLANSYYWWALYFRPSILKANSLEAPKTWDDLLNACDVLNAKGITPIAIGTKFVWPAAAWFDYINMRLNGPEFHINLMDLKEKYDDPKVKAVFMKWKEMFDHKCFLKDSAALDWNEAVTPLVKGEAAMYFMGGFITDTWDPATKDNPELQKDLDFVRFPIIDPNQKIGEDAPADGWFISAKAANPDGAKKFLAWLGSKEYQQMLVTDLKRLPTRTDLPSDNFTDASKKGLDLLQKSDVLAQFFDRDTTPEMYEKAYVGFASFFADPSEKNVDAILKDLEATRAQLAAEAEK
jgi:ABC-type glycerol-3-phosphate transport system substrate-binding protein